MEITFNFSSLKTSINNLIMFIKKNYKSFIIFSLIGLLFSIITTTFFLDEKYQATTEILVDEKLSEEKFGKNINLAWIETYRKIAMSDKVLESVVNETKLNYTKNQLKENIVIEADGNSLLFTIQLLAESPKDAAKLSESLIKHFSKEIGTLQNVKDVKILKTTKADNKPVYPKTYLNLFLGIFYGFLFAAIFHIVKLVVNKKAVFKSKILTK